MRLSLDKICYKKKEIDYYYKIDLTTFNLNNGLKRAVRRASKFLRIIESKEISTEHKEIITEFIDSKKLNPQVRELFKTVETYTKESESTIILNALNDQDKLVAFYVLDFSAKKFLAYVIGCYSRKNYVSNASDLLMLEMINLSKSMGKEFINLGLGVNAGIRRFKEKWGGFPFLRYEFRECNPNGQKIDIFKIISSFQLKRL